MSNFLEVKAFGKVAAIEISPDKEKKGWFLQAAQKADGKFDWRNGITMGLSPTEGLALAALMAGHTDALWDMNSGKRTGFFHQPRNSKITRKVVGEIKGTHARIRVQERNDGVDRLMDISICPKYRVEIATFLFSVSGQLTMFENMLYSDIQDFSKSFFSSLNLHSMPASLNA